MRIEPPFIHVDEAATTSESRFAALYKTESRITGSPTATRQSNSSAAQIGIAPEMANLADQVERAQDTGRRQHGATGAALRRAHRYLSYRYDSWLLGLVSQRIAAQRAADSWHE